MCCPDASLKNYCSDCLDFFTQEALYPWLGPPLRRSECGFKHFLRIVRHWEIGQNMLSKYATTSNLRCDKYIIIASESVSSLITLLCLYVASLLLDLQFMECGRGSFKLRAMDRIQNKVTAWLMDAQGIEQCNRGEEVV